MVTATAGHERSDEAANPSPRRDTPEQRVIDAALACFARWGIAKTTAEDIGREAGVSRATVYRVFPGGKAAILEAAGTREIQRILTAVVDATSSQATLGDVLSEGIVVACEQLRTHPTLSYLLEHEPETVLPFLAFDRLGPALALARHGCATTVSRFVPIDTAEELVEWATRMALSLTFQPGRIDPANSDSIRSMVTDFVLPGVADELFDPPLDVIDLIDAAEPATSSHSTSTHHPRRHQRPVTTTRNQP